MVPIFDDKVIEMRQCIDRKDVVALAYDGARLLPSFSHVLKCTCLLVFLVISSLQSKAQTAGPDVSRTSPPSVTLLLSPNDLPGVYYATLTLAANWGWETSPVIAAMEPGPLILKGGLKIIPNQIPPRLTIPDLLIVSTMGDLDMKIQFIAFLRRVLLNGGAVWVVGSQFPESLMTMPLSAGQEIALVSPQELEQRLARIKPEPIMPAPNFWFLLIRLR